MTSGAGLADRAERLQAVGLRRGGLSLVAGAGTGKTHTLIHRLLLGTAARHADCPRDRCRQEGPFLAGVLVTTFTDRAAREMRLRIGGTLRLLGFLGASALARGGMEDIEGRLAALAARGACLRDEIRALDGAALGTFHALASRSIRAARAARGASLLAAVETDPDRSLTEHLEKHLAEHPPPRGLLRALRRTPDAFADARLRDLIEEALRLASHPEHGAAAPEELARRILLTSKEAARATFLEAAAALERVREGIERARVGGRKTLANRALQYVGAWIEAARRGAAEAASRFPLDETTRTSLLEAIHKPQGDLSLQDTADAARDQRLGRWKKPARVLRAWLRGAILFGHGLGEDGMRQIVTWAILLGAHARARARNADRIRYEDLLLEFRDDLLGVGAGAEPRPAFHEILVDEAQDTDPVQGDLVSILGSDHVPSTAQTRAVPLEPRHRVVLAVGDEKQCIYTWRSADLENFRRLRERLATARLPIELRANFRSRPGVLEPVNALFAKAFATAAGEQTARLLPGDESSVAATAAQVLVPTRGESKAGPRSKVRILFLPEKEDREAWLAIGELGIPVRTYTRAHDLTPRVRGNLEIDALLHRILELREEGAAWRDLVILYRANTGGLVDRLVRALSRAGIPHHQVGSRGLLEIPEVRELHHLLRAAVLGAGDPRALWTAVHTAWFPAAVAAAERTEPSALARRYRNLERRRGGRDAGPVDGEARPRSSDPLHEALAILLATSRDHEAMPLAAAGRRLLDRIAARTTLATTPGASPEARRHVEVNLEAFLARIATLEGEGLDAVTVLERARMAPREESQTAQALSESADVVRIQTVFSAKGLEFAHVLLLGTSSIPSDSGLDSPVIFADASPVPLACLTVFPDPRRGGDPASRPAASPALRPGPLAVRHRIRKKQQRWNEAMRLLYVGMTRARESFFLFVPWRRGDREDPWGPPSWARLLVRFREALASVRGVPDLVETIDTATREGRRRLRDIVEASRGSRTAPASPARSPGSSPARASRPGEPPIQARARPPGPELVDPSRSPRSIEELEPLPVTALLHPREDRDPRDEPPVEPPARDKEDGGLERETAVRLGTLLHRLLERHPGDPEGFAASWSQLRRDPRFLAILRDEVAGGEEAACEACVARGDALARELPGALASLLSEDPRELTWYPELPLAGRIAAREIVLATRDPVLTRDPTPELRAVLARARRDPRAPIALQGVADLVALDEAEHRGWILDYKTGRVDPGDAARIRAEAQLSLYRQLLQAARPGIEVITGILGSGR